MRGDEHRMTLLSNPFDLPTGRLLGLDLGQARHGVAVCDELGMLATPLTTLARTQTRAEDFAAIAALVVREKAVGILVGLPDEQRRRTFCTGSLGQPLRGSAGGLPAGSGGVLG